MVRVRALGALTGSSSSMTCMTTVSPRARPRKTTKAYMVTTPVVEVGWCDLLQLVSLDSPRAEWLQTSCRGDGAVVGWGARGGQRRSRTHVVDDVGEDEVADLGERHRPAEQVALAELAAHLLQVAQLLTGLDALGDELQVEDTGHRHDRGQQPT